MNDKVYINNTNAIVALRVANAKDINELIDIVNNKKDELIDIDSEYSDVDVVVSKTLMYNSIDEKLMDVVECANIAMSSGMYTGFYHSMYTIARKIELAIQSNELTVVN